MTPKEFSREELDGSALDRRKLLTGIGAAAAAAVLERVLPAHASLPSENIEKINKKDWEKFRAFLRDFYSNVGNISHLNIVAAGDKRAFGIVLFQSAAAVKESKKYDNILEAVADEAFQKETYNRIKDSETIVSDGKQTGMVLGIMLEDMMAHAARSLLER